MYAQMEISNCLGKFPVVSEVRRFVWESWARGHVLGALFPGIRKRERILFSIYPKIKYMEYLLYFIFLGHVLGIFTILISYYLLHFFGRNSVVESKKHLFRSVRQIWIQVLTSNLDPGQTIELTLPWFFF